MGELMGFKYLYAKSMFGRSMKPWWKRVLCWHEGWKEIGVEDWRTNEKYYQCRYCGEIRNYGYKNPPVNLDLSDYR